MIDLFIRAGNAGALASAFPWLRGVDEFDEPYWKQSGEGFAFQYLGPVVTTPGIYEYHDDESVTVIQEPVIDPRAHGILRCTEAISALVDDQFIVTEYDPPVKFAGDPPPDFAARMAALKAQREAASKAGAQA